MPQTPFRNLQTDNEKATENTFRWLFSLLVQIETLLEAINTSAGVYQLLLTREEGVALGANVNDDVLLGGAGLNDIAAGTAAVFSRIVFSGAEAQNRSSTTVSDSGLRSSSWRPGSAGMPAP